MKRILTACLILAAMPAFAQTANYGPKGWTATATGAATFPFGGNPYVPSPQAFVAFPSSVATINITATASGTSTTWTAQIEQASASTGPWTVCGSAVTITANATNTGTCTPSGSSFLEVVVTAGSGGGTLTGSLLGYPASSGSSVTFAGDLSGNNTSQTVIGINGGAPPTDGNLGAWNSAGQPVQPTSGTLAALTVTGITDPGTGPTSTGATAGGTVGVSTFNYAECQAILVNPYSPAAAVKSDITPISAAITTTSPNQTIPWTCPISVPTQALGTVIVYGFVLCQGSSCTPANADVSYTNTFSQTQAAINYPSLTPDPGNTTGTVLQGAVSLPLVGAYGLATNGSGQLIAQNANDLLGMSFCLSDTASGSAYGCVNPFMPSVSFIGQAIVAFDVINTGAATLAANGGPAYPIEKETSAGPVAIVAGDIQPLQVSTVTLINSTYWLLQTPGTTCSAGTACAPSSVTVNSGTTVMDRCNGGTSDGMYVADGSTQATACTAGSGTLVSTGITTP